MNKPGWAPVKLPLNGRDSYSYSIYVYAFNGPAFGRGGDIYISSYASSNSYSYSNLGDTYSLYLRYRYGYIFARTFLAGTYKFTPDEVETFYETT